MTDYLFRVYFVVHDEIAACVFEVGSNAMRFAMDLERQGYLPVVKRQATGKPNSSETIYEADGFVPLGEQRAAYDGFRGRVD